MKTYVTLFKDGTSITLNSPSIIDMLTLLIVTYNRKESDIISVTIIN